MSELSKQNDLAPGANKSVSESLTDELLNPSIDLSIDYSELFIDQFIENEALQNIPVIKSIIGVIKGGAAISQFWFAKKLLQFIREFHSGTVKPEKLTEFKDKLSADKSFGQKIAERLMVYIDRNIEIKQTQIIANLFSAFVNDDLSLEEFNNIVIALDRLDPKAYSAFFEFEKINFEITEDNRSEIERNFAMETIIANSGLAWKPSSWFSGFRMTEEGQKLFQFGIKPSITTKTKVQ